MNRPQFVELQSLRGIAAVAVMIGHSLNYYETSQLFHRAALIFNGRAAVVIFFVLSGFVLTLSLQGKGLQTEQISAFYIRRFFRIYPAIWVASGVSLLYLTFLHFDNPLIGVSAGVQGQFRRDRFDSLHILASFAGMLAFLLPQLWSVFVEIVASATMPVVAFLFYCRFKTFTVSVIFSVFLSFLLNGLTYYNISLYYCDFLVGALLVLIYRQRDRKYFAKFFNLPMLGIASVSMCLTQYLPGSYYSPATHIIESLLASYIVITLCVRQINWLRSKALCWLGDVSFSIYLIHYVVICTLAIFLRLNADFNSLSGDEKAPFLALATTLVTLPLSFIVFWFVERKGVALGNAIVLRLNSRVPRIGSSTMSSKTAS